MRKKDFIVNPYKHYQKIHDDKILASEEVNRDAFIRVKTDPKVVKTEIKKQLDEAKKYKEKFIYNAMKLDPAFMVDPIKDYYMHLIPDELLETLTDDEIQEIIAYYDPVTWAKKNLFVLYGGWEPRTSKNGFPYQAQLVRSISKRISARAGRRIGKTLSVAVRILHRAFTWRKTKNKGHYNIVIFTPNQTQIQVIFKMFEQLLEGNSKLLSMVGLDDKHRGKIPTRKTPNFILELTNGVTISGFVSGSTAIRGSAADMLVLDEASFLTSADTDAVTSLINEHQDVDLWVSSTPAGPKDYFYDRVTDPRFVSFYFPTDKYHPEWSLQMEADFKSQLTNVGYTTEVLANFIDDGQTVFQKDFVLQSLRDYSYDDCSPKHTEGWMYSMGIDWNDSANGTQIVVLGYNIKEKYYKIVDKSSVHIQGWTQTKAIQEIVRLNRKWLPEMIYTDYGFGAGQNERLHEIGLTAAPNSPDRKLLTSKVINFSSSIEVTDPWTKQKIKKPTKSYMINNAVRVFEGELINISKRDNLLIDQLIGYSIDRINPSGVPVYKPDPKVGDHILDALVLALFSFHMEYSSLTNPPMDPAASTLNVISKPIFPYNRKSSIPTLTATDMMLERDKAFEKEEEENAKAVGTLLAQQSKPQMTRRESPNQYGAINRSKLFSMHSTGMTRRRF